MSHLSFPLRILSLLICLATPGMSAEPIQAPGVPSHVVLKPTFMSGQDSFSGGTAFLCRVQGVPEPLLLTAHHLFGPACGLERDFTWQEVPQIFVAVTGLSIADPTKAITSTRPMTIPGARGSDDQGYAHDLAAYRVDLPSVRATLHLSETQPKEGDTVYLHGRQRGKETLDMLPAIVQVSNETELVYAFVAKDIALAGTSGAPVLNQAGEVVALNVGGGESQGSILGMGNPAKSILKLLARAK